MSKCSICGAQNDDGATYCKDCGSKLVAENPVTDNGNSIYEGIGTENPDPNKNKSSVLIYIISGIVIAFALFTIFNVLVCEDIINGAPGSGLENYEYSILNTVAPEKVLGIQSSAGGANGAGTAAGTNTPTPSVPVTDASAATAATVNTTPWEPSTTATTEPTTMGTVTDPPTTTKKKTTQVNYDGQVKGTGRSGLILRASPSTGARQINCLPEGTKIDILDQVQNIDDNRIWYQVRYKGNTGWVAGEYIKLSKGFEEFD